MKVNLHLWRLGQATALVVLLAATSVWSQIATHFCNGYVSPATITITNTFTYPAGSTLGMLTWYMYVPTGWTVTNVRGNGSPVLDGSGYIGFTAYSFTSPVVFTYDLIVPPGEVGPKEITAYCYQDITVAGGEWIEVTPQSLMLENLAKTLQVISAYDTATPAVGFYTNVVGTSLSPSVTQYSPYVGTTQYVCTGWTMTGNAPASGSANSFSMTVAGDAVLTWNWGVYNVMPTIAADLQKVGYRTATNVWDEALLLGQVSDPDAGDTKTLVSVDAHSVYGGAITRDNGKLIYTTPAHTDAVQDSFTYTVQDSKGAAAVGTVKVTVSYGATFIRVF